MDPQTRRGFTLLEVLVALTITALCLALVSASLAGVFRADQRAREQLDLQQSMNETMARLRLYIQAAYLSPYVANSFKTTFKTEDTDSAAEPYDALTLTTLAHSSHRPNAKESDLIEVTFFAEPEPPLQTPEGTLDLRRLRLRVGGTINDRHQVDGGVVHTLADHLTRLKFEYLDFFGEWKPEWIIADNAGALPCMVKVTLGLRTENYDEVTNTLIIPLEMTDQPCRFDDERIFQP